MLFHTIQFAVFFVITYALYVVMPHRWQNRMLLVASYYFYGSWDWYFLSLIIVSTVVDYFCAQQIDKTENVSLRKKYLSLSIIINLSILGVFKYFNFFSESLDQLMDRFGIIINPLILDVALPVGISFYTFQTISYSIDVYRGKLRPCADFIDFALYVAFFPQLVAGPIERGLRLLPQILNPRQLSLSKFKSGTYLVFWGLFMKVVIADNMADIVDPVYGGDTPGNGALYVLATYAFAIQIFCDFSGYSLMAIGFSLMMGIELMENFRRPYFSRDISDFWRRWHISLSSWFRDYLYIPLGGDRKGNLRACVNIFIVFSLCGLWHGAGWNFIVWGVFNALMIGIFRAIEKPWLKVNRFIQILVTFNIVCIGWIIFRSDTPGAAWSVVCGFFDAWDLSDPFLREAALSFILLLLPLLIHELIEEWKDNRYVILLAPRYVQYVIYSLLFISLLIFGNFGERKFIYFQF